MSSSLAGGAIFARHTTGVPITLQVRTSDVPVDPMNTTPDAGENNAGLSTHRSTHPRARERASASLRGREEIEAQRSSVAPLSLAGRGLGCGSRARPLISPFLPDSIGRNIFALRIPGDPPAYGPTHPLTPSLLGREDAGR